MNALDYALSQIGVKETGANAGEPHTRFALRGESPAPWCARFVRWCFANAGASLPGNQWEIGNVAKMRAELAAQGCLLADDAKPVAGDIGFIKGRAESDAGTGNHVFLVEYVGSAVVRTIEGNLANEVKRFTRRLDDRRSWGFARWP